MIFVNTIYHFLKIDICVVLKKIVLFVKGVINFHFLIFASVGWNSGLKSLENFIVVTNVHHYIFFIFQL